jgi:hypothetical protein
MRADADFMVYVVARWPALVREAVLLGCPPEEAAEATTDALSRCRRDWGRASQEENVDHLVHDELLAAVGRRSRTDAATRPGLADGLLVLAPPTLDELVDQKRRNDAGARRRSALVAVPVLLVAAGVGAYVATDGHDAEREPAKDEIGQVEVERAENPAPGVTWYAAGQLHLDHVVLEVEGIRDMTRLGNGVVYGDDQGRVVYAADDGRRELLGHKDADTPVAASDETGRAAWYDPDTEEVRVVEASTGEVSVVAAATDEPEVVAVDGDAVYLVGSEGARALTPTGEALESPVSPAQLLDVRSRIRVFQKEPDTIQVVQSAFNAVFELPGHGADLSPDGNTVATRGADGGVLLYDTRSGVQLDGRLGGGDEVLAVAPGDRGTVAYVVRDGDGAQLRTCELEDLRCRTVDLVGVGTDAVLAR